MRNSTLLRLIGALFAVAMLSAACGSDATTTDEAMSDDEMSDDHSDDHDDDHGDDHSDDGHGAATIDVDASLPIPDVSMELNETDEPGVFDMTVTLTNFTITPENVDGDPIDNEGHMHLLLDGVKVEKFYDLERQVMVPDGEHLVEVEINANNHSAYAIDGEPIRSGQTVTGAGEAMAMDDDASHDDDHSHDAAGPAVEEGLTMQDATASLSATFESGSVALDGDERLEASVGDVVLLTIMSDVAEDAHLHGYDLLAPVEPGESAMILFTADTAGKFELEFEKSGTFIAELVVS